jgi:hypothetical protein
MAFIRVSFNLGFSIGALLTGLALGLLEPAQLIVLPLAAGLLFLVNSIFIARLPSGVPARANREINPFRSSALRDFRFVRLAIINGFLNAHETLLAVVLPLWILHATHAPRPLIAWFAVLNTALVVTFQVIAARGADSLGGSLLLARRSAILFALTCLSAMVTYWLTSPIAAALVLTLTYVLLTWTELWHSGAEWGIFVAAAPEGRRGEYQGIWGVGAQSVTMLGPAGLSYLAIDRAPFGWLAIAAVVGVAGLLVTRAASHVAEPHTGVDPN